MEAFMMQKLVGRLAFAGLVLVAALALTTPKVAAEKLRVSYSAVNSTQAFLWVAQERGGQTLPLVNGDASAPGYWR
jgi:hypothetical protein